MSREGIAGLVLAGGRGTRMGRDKATVEWEGVPLVRRQLRALSSIGMETVRVSRARGQPALEDDIPVLFDRESSRGPLGGIVSGLEWAERLKPHALPLLVLAVDMPLVDDRFLLRLLDQAEPGLGVAPRVGDRWEPLCAIYPPGSLSLAREELRLGDASPSRLIERLNEDGALSALDLIPAEGRLLKSWNRPEALPDPDGSSPESR